MEGIAKAKKKGVYKGRKLSIDPDALKALIAKGKNPTEINIELGVSQGISLRLSG